MTANSQSCRLFRRVATQRLEDARFLLQAGRTLSAVYLSGYSVECMLKALLLASVPASREPAAMETFRGRAGHDYNNLRQMYLDEGGSDFPRDIAEHFARVNTWSVELRYRPGPIRPADAILFLQSVTAIVQWAEGRL